MRKRKCRYFVGDFETTVYKGQDFTEVWASGIVELYSEDAIIHHSIGETFSYLKKLRSNVIVYYHNLKFDGTFWISYFLLECKYKQAFIPKDDEWTSGTWCEDELMENNTFKYSVADRGQWYSIKVKVHDRIIEFRDSLKLLPFSVKRLGEGFRLKHRKLEMDYEGYRYSGCVITDKEQEYLKNDLYVVKEALEFMFNAGHKSMTIGSCCLNEYKSIMGKRTYEDLYPNVYDVEIAPEHKYKTAGDYIARSYRGGWCYLAKGRGGHYWHSPKGKLQVTGTTADVNSLYPSMMHSESGNRYPVGYPKWWTGNYIPQEAQAEDRYYFIRIRTRFYLRKGYLPFVQIKGSRLYKGTECLESSDFYDADNGVYLDSWTDEHGNTHSTMVELVLTMTDYKLLIEHYELVDFEIVDGCHFRSEIGLFDEYIDTYRKIKVESKGAKRELAKLFLNNLYGKMAANTDSSFKIIKLDEHGAIKFQTVTESEKMPGYIPVGSAITSYARNFTIRAAQKNYHGADKPGFIYADTDSIHCNLPPEGIVGIRVHESAFCCWKLESCWDEAYFTRQKTYIEHMTHADLEPIERPYYNVKCAGMPEKCKQFFIESVTQSGTLDESKLTEEEKEFIHQKRELKDFDVGLSVPGKLRPVRIRGGTLLMEVPYVMHAPAPATISRKRKKQ